MAKDELIDSHVSLAQCKKAVNALASHATKVAKQREDNELLPGKEENVWLVLSVKKTTPEKKLKPFKIPLVHPIVDPRTTPVCLITKDPQREYKDLLESHNIKFVSRVVGVTKLKGKFKPFEARRMLMRENGLFLADERVVPLLPGLLGKIFFDAKKQPIPVSLVKKDLKGELERAVSSTYMHQNRGTCTSVKIGTISQSSAQLLDNLKSALPAISKRIEGGWDNIQSFNIKTNSSVSLPIWSCKLGHGDGARWEQENGSDSEEEPPKKVADAKKGKKRNADEESETPNKKAKKQVLVKPVPKEAPKKDTSSDLKTVLNQGELKKKRAGEGLEKKKEKVAKRKIGGSVKEEVIGKKSRARI